MKKTFLILLTTTLLANVYGQQAKELSSQRYRMESYVTDQEAQAVLDTLESNFPLYQKWFAAAAQQPSDPLNIYFYRNVSAFKDALATQNVEQRTDFLYLYFGNPKRDALNIYPLDNEQTMRSSLNRHGFLQFVFAVQPTAPAWLREGLALYFEAIQSAEGTGQAIVPPNQMYLENLKRLNKENPLPLKELYSAADENFENDLERGLVYAWGLANYLANSDEALLKQAMALLDNKKSQEENTAAIAKLLSSSSSLESGFSAYIENTPSFSDLIEQGRGFYDKQQYAEAAASFQKAAEARPDLYEAFYYQGLTAYSQGNLQAAEENYKKALSKGAPQPLISFALGMRAYAGKNYAEASQLFTQAKEGDYARYGKTAEEMLSRISEDQNLDAQISAADSANIK